MTGRPLTLKEYVVSEEAQKDNNLPFESSSSREAFFKEYNRYKWTFVDQTRQKDWSKVVSDARKKVKMINDRKKNYDVMTYNCQSTAQEVILMLASNPEHSWFRTQSVKNCV